MERKSRYVPLSKQPLVLVLAQIRFSPVRQIGDYIPLIQEEFRRHGFPIERAGKVKQLVLPPGGGMPSLVEEQRWEYRTKDERWSILVMQDRVVLQTTAYDRFESFANKLEHALRTVFSKTEHDQFGIVERVGLRYIDLVQPRKGESHLSYLRPGLHGVAADVFQPRTHRVYVESKGETKVGDIPGTMIVRVVQNDQGFDLPPDLAGGAPKHESRAERGELVSLIDMDHFIEGSFDPAAGWVIERMYEMHDHLIETFHGHVVTKEAIRAWE